MTGIGFMYASEAERATIGWMVAGAFVMMVVLALWYALDRSTR